MATNKDRKRDMAFYALPPKDTKEYDARIKHLENYIKAHPENDKIISTLLKRAGAIIQAQIENGAGLPLDQEIRYFLGSFNDRNMEYGLRSMPQSFNVLEGFFNYHPEASFLNYLKRKIIYFHYLIT